MKKYFALILFAIFSFYNCAFADEAKKSVKTQAPIPVTQDYARQKQPQKENIPLDYNPNADYYSRIHYKDENKKKCDNNDAEACYLLVGFYLNYF